MFLIDHFGGGVDLLWEAVSAVRAAHPGLRVGVNHLGGGTPSAVMQAIDAAVVAGALERAPDSLWCDHSCGSATGLQRACDAASIKTSRRSLDPMTYFGGVAFKYTSTYTDDPAAAADEASELAPFVDVVTTSGAGTNQAASAAKVEAMHAVLPGRRLALASGVSPENLMDYAPFVTDVLVASSVETASYSGELVPERVHALVAAAASQ